MLARVLTTPEPSIKVGVIFETPFAVTDGRAIIGFPPFE